MTPPYTRKHFPFNCMVCKKKSSIIINVHNGMRLGDLKEPMIMCKKCNKEAKRNKKEKL